MKKRCLLLLFTLVIMIALILPACTAPAPQEINLKFSAWNTEFGGVSVSSKKVFEQIESRTNVMIERHWTGSLIPAKEEVEGVGQGIADFAQVMQPFQARLSLMSVGLLPGFGADLETQGQNMIKLSQLDAVKDQLDQNNLMIIGIHGGDPTHIMSKEPIRTIDDLKGMKIRLVGEAGKALKSLGAVPVGITSGEMYEAFERGTIDGVCSSLAGFNAFKLEEIGKYVTKMYLYSNMFYSIMSKDAWDNLPGDIKKVFEEEFGKMPEIYNGVILSKGKKVQEELYPQVGIEVIELSAADKAKVTEVSLPVWEEWVTKMEGNNLPGREILNKWKEWNGIK